MPRPADDSQGSVGLEFGKTFTTNDLKKRCVEDLKKVPYEWAPEVLAKIIIKAVAIEWIGKTVRLSEKCDMRSR